MKTKICISIILLWLLITGPAYAWQTFTSTAYSETGNMTFTETWPVEGKTIAVDPEVIPLESAVLIKSLGWHIAEDTGGYIKGKRIDIYMQDEIDCINWGKRDIKVKMFNLNIIPVI